MKRIFLAIDILPGPRILEAFDLIRHRLRTERISWTVSSQWHITLAFLGDTENEVIPHIISDVERALEPYPPFNITLSTVGVFPKLHDPRVIWVGCDADPGFRKIKDDLDKVLIPFGYVPERKVFSPHLTLGRIKSMRNQNQLAQVIAMYKDVVFQNDGITNVVLYESILKPEGPEYEVVKRFMLK